MPLYGGMTIALPADTRPPRNVGFMPISAPGITLYCRAMLSIVSPWATVWRRNRDLAGLGQSRAGSGFSTGVPEGRFAGGISVFAAVFPTGAIDQSSAEISRNKRLNLIM